MKKGKRKKLQIKLVRLKAEYDALVYILKSTRRISIWQENEFMSLSSKIAVLTEKLKEE